MALGFSLLNFLWVMSFLLFFTIYIYIYINNLFVLYLMIEKKINKKIWNSLLKFIMNIYVIICYLFKEYECDGSFKMLVKIVFFFN
jgi:hypothetical protein